MRCPRCEYGSAEQEYHIFCPECSQEVDLYSEPLKKSARAIRTLREQVGRRGLNETELEEVAQWAGTQDVFRALAPYLVRDGG